MSETADGEAVSDSDAHVTHSRHRSKHHRNGHPVESETESDSYARAEQALDEMGAKVGKYLATVGKHLTRWTMRAREEAEDIVIEARDLRRKMGKKS